MAGNQIFLTDADLYNRLGGQAELTKLMDPKRTGVWTAGVSLTVRSDACNLVLAAAGVPSDMSGYTAADFSAKFPHLITVAALKAIALAWLFCSAGQAMPAQIAAYAAAADAELERIATRRRKHGASDFSPQPSQAINGSIDNDPNLDRMTMSSWRCGFFC